MEALEITLTTHLIHIYFLKKFLIQNSISKPPYFKCLLWGIPLPLTPLPEYGAFFQSPPPQKKTKQNKTQQQTNTKLPQLENVLRPTFAGTQTTQFET